MGKDPTRGMGTYAVAYISISTSNYAGYYILVDTVATGIENHRPLGQVYRLDTGRVARFASEGFSTNGKKIPPGQEEEEKPKTFGAYTHAATVR